MWVGWWWVNSHVLGWLPGPLNCLAVFTHQLVGVWGSVCELLPHTPQDPSPQNKCTLHPSLIFFSRPKQTQATKDPCPQSTLLPLLPSQPVYTQAGRGFFSWPNCQVKEFLAPSTFGIPYIITFDPVVSSKPAA